MTDRELLLECLEAVEAFPVASKSRKLLKKWGCQVGAYAGNGSHILADVMARRIREHIEQ